MSEQRAPFHPCDCPCHDGGNSAPQTDESAPVLVATNVSYCVTHGATDHDDGRAWTACRFRQLFYFDNPMDEHTILWSDEIHPAPISDSCPGGAE